MQCAKWLHAWVIRTNLWNISQLNFLHMLLAPSIRVQSGENMTVISGKRNLPTNFPTYFQENTAISMKKERYLLQPSSFNHSITLQTIRDELVCFSESIITDSSQKFDFVNAFSRGDHYYTQDLLALKLDRSCLKLKIQSRYLSK